MPTVLARRIPDPVNRGRIVVAIGVGFRELMVVVAVALTGLVLAALAALTPWYAGPSGPRAPIVTVESPGGVADGR
jgi:hypothetical protein